MKNEGYPTLGSSTCTVGDGGGGRVSASAEGRGGGGAGGAKEHSEHQQKDAGRGVQASQAAVATEVAQQ